VTAEIATRPHGWQKVRPLECGRENAGGCHDPPDSKVPRDGGLAGSVLVVMRTVLRRNTQFVQTWKQDQSPFPSCEQELRVGTVALGICEW